MAGRCPGRRPTSHREGSGSLQGGRAVVVQLRLEASACAGRAHRPSQSRKAQGGHLSSFVAGQLGESLVAETPRPMCGHRALQRQQLARFANSLPERSLATLCGCLFRCAAAVVPLHTCLWRPCLLSRYGLLSGQLPPSLVAEGDSWVVVEFSSLRPNLSPPTSECPTPISAVGTRVIVPRSSTSVTHQCLGQHVTMAPSAGRLMRCCGSRRAEGWLAEPQPIGNSLDEHGCARDIQC